MGRAAKKGPELIEAFTMTVRESDMEYVIKQDGRTYVATSTGLPTGLYDDLIPVTYELEKYCKRKKRVKNIMARMQLDKQSLPSIHAKR